MKVSGQETHGTNVFLTMGESCVLDNGDLVNARSDSSLFGHGSLLGDALMPARAISSTDPYKPSTVAVLSYSYC